MIDIPLDVAYAPREDRDTSQQPDRKYPQLWYSRVSPTLETTDGTMMA